MTIGALAFLNPWLLAALASLPLIYWLLKTVPPRPKQVAFPATRILVGLEDRDRTPAKTPWWLLLIRLLAAALVILALAEPVLNPSRETALKGAGPVAVVIDNGWSAAPRWTERTAFAERIISDAESRGRPLIVIETAPAARARAVKIEAPSDARNTLAGIAPQPFPPERKTALEVLGAAMQAAGPGAGDASVVWLADGIDHDGATAAFADGLAALATGGSFAILADPPGREALGQSAEVASDGKLASRVVRTGGPAREGVAHAFSAKGARLGEAAFKLGAGGTSTDMVFELPLELRNQVTRVEIAGELSAGAVSILDRRSQWQRIGLISGETQEQAQPLLAPLYYINKAVQPFAEIIRPKDANLAAGVDTVFKSNATVLMLADIGTLSGDIADTVDAWVRKGGILVRFAGPRLEKGGDELLPVGLRLGGRTLGGALSWSTPQPLAPFDDTSIFAGLAVPADISIRRQVLADPARLTGDVKVWARLKDGTPLVTAARRGEGTVVLFHVTANSDWSNLPISGLFVEMLRRITTLGGAGGGGSDATTTDTAGLASSDTETAGLLAPLQTLDGFGTLKSPPPTAQPIPVAKLASVVAGLEHPPGYYGPAGSPRAVNVIKPGAELAPLPALPSAAERRGYESEASKPLKPWLLAAALGLLFADVLAILLMQSSGLRRRKPAGLSTTGGAAALLFAAALALASDSGHAQSTEPPVAPVSPGNEATAQQATEKVTLGYVLTGDSATDSASRFGLSGLCRILTTRTAVDPGEPIGVDIVNDEIAFYPVLYWPVLDDARALPSATLAKIDAYMKQGGMIVFDTRDFGGGSPTGFGIGGQRSSALQRLIGALDLPRLEPVPEDHVLTKSFYLLRTFPGRYSGGELWVEADSKEGDDTGRKARRADGVSSILITSNDFASAWALDERGRPLFASIGGENQREMAFRAGVNIVMHALTGNYKADQVHVPALLERLGQ
ncbi:MAG: DUF4159 domain-containing protein [Hyphomicrobium sp.]